MDDEAGTAGEALTHDERPTPGEPEIAALTRAIREFSAERDWEQFHDPKSLLLAITGELGELAELFQWVPAADAVSRFGDPALRARAGEEMADVTIYLLRLADVLGVDLGEATRAKLALNRGRFAADEVRGVAPDKR